MPGENQQGPYDYSVKRLLSLDTVSPSSGEQPTSVETFSDRDVIPDRSNVLMNPPPKNRARRARTYFDDRSIQILEHAFVQEQYPDIHRREQLSNEIGTSEARVQVWFQNKRSRCRKRIGGKANPNENEIEHDKADSKLSSEPSFDMHSRTPMKTISSANMSPMLPFTPNPVQSLLASHFPFFLQHLY